MAGGWLSEALGKSAGIAAADETAGDYISSRDEVISEIGMTAKMMKFSGFGSFREYFFEPSDAPLLLPSKVYVVMSLFRGVR